MDLHAGQSKKTNVVLKWTVCLTVFSFVFLTYVSIRESIWLQPLSATFTFPNFTAAAAFKANLMFESLNRTSHGSAENDQTPKVALLFLTKESLPHEPLWRAFFEAASRLSLRHSPPDLSYLNSIAGKDREKFDEINEATNRKLSQIENRKNYTRCHGENQMLKREMKRFMRAANDPSSVIAGQSLFSVYTHPRPEFRYPATSIFFQTEVQDRVDTADSWGRFNLIEAELRLMETALEDTNNKKLILLSESCIPLYPPEVIYAQLMSELKSRMRSCGSKSNTNPGRFSNSMEWKHFSRNNWRKNDQWFSLNRAHAEVIVNDTYFKNLFRRNCDGHHGERFCVADEHYIPSALDAYGLGDQTDCIGTLTFVKFHGGDHPIAFHPSGIKPSLLMALRHTQECDANGARTTAAALLDRLPRNGGCISNNLTTFNISNEADLSHNWVTERGYKPLKYRCVLFARKFPANAVRQTLWASLSCKGGSLGYWC